MLARRIASALAAVLMLHLSLVSGDAPCANHGEPMPVGRSHLVVGHHGHDLATSDAGTTEAPCRIPAQPECCRAMTPCTTAQSLASGVRVGDEAVDRDLVEPEVMDAPRSAVASPDPPPPRA
jgi:hypothetical protein